MARVLIVYATTEGQTRKIAARVAEYVRARRHQADVVDSAALPGSLAPAEYQAYILAGSLHQEKHQASLVSFVREHRDTLSARPSAFLSVSMTAAIRDAKHLADAQRCIDQFVEETGWTPTVTEPVAGALLYTRYDWLKRMLMRLISSREGGQTDTSRDWEYTDWAALEAFVDRFLRERAAG
jgi:menaquinone-dependent protoporphyrinogen oxidase